MYVSEETILEGFAGVAQAIAFDAAIAVELTKLLNEAHVAVKAQRKRDVDGFRRELLALEPGENRLF
jgi:hypothetical protein